RFDALDHPVEVALARPQRAAVGVEAEHRLPAERRVGVGAGLGELVAAVVVGLHAVPRATRRPDGIAHVSGFGGDAVVERLRRRLVGRALEGAAGQRVAVDAAPVELARDAAELADEAAARLLREPLRRAQGRAVVELALPTAVDHERPGPTPRP